VKNLPGKPFSDGFQTVKLLAPETTMGPKEDSMNKAELTVALATATGFSKTDTARLLDSLLQTLTSELEAGNKVSIQGFGVFTSKVRDARTARNPKTGGTVDVPAKRVVKFSPGTNLNALKI